MFSPYSGILVLEGKECNYAEYEGTLFFLAPIELIDKTRNKVKYSIIRDEWAFAVKNKIKIQGTVTKTLDPYLLRSNLQLAQPVIPQPAKLNIVNLFEDEEEELIISEHEDLSFLQTEQTISKRGLNSLIDKQVTNKGAVLFPSTAKS